MKITLINLPRINNKFFSSCGGYGSLTDYSVTPTFLLMLAQKEKDNGNEIELIDLQIEPEKEIPQSDKIITIMFSHTNPEQEKILRQIMKGQPKKTKLETYTLPYDKIFFDKKLPKTMYELIDVQKYDVIDAYTSLYCPYQCTYCVMTMSRNPILYKDLDDFAEEFRYLESRGIRKVTFSDPEFTINKKRLLEFAEEYKKNRFSFSYEISARADCLSEDVVKKLKETNCFRVGIGIERPTDKGLKQIKKNLSYDKIKKAIKILKDNNIKVSGFFIFGFPNDSKKTYEQIKRRIMELGLDSGRVNVFTPYPNTEIWKETLKEGLINPDAKDKPELFGHFEYAICRTKYLSKKQVDDYITELNNILTIKNRVPLAKYIIQSRQLTSLASKIIIKTAYLTKKIRR